jgi:ATP-dependent Clp protease ATP-binding subunit ClpA
MLAHRGFNPKYGARQVAGTIRTHIRRPVSKMLIGGKVKSGDTLAAGLDDRKELTWNVK